MTTIFLVSISFIEVLAFPIIYKWCSRHFDLPLQAHREEINLLANSPELLSAYPFLSTYLPSIPLHSIHSKFRHLHSIYWLYFLQKSTALHYHLLFFSTSCHFYQWQTESQEKKYGVFIWPKCNCYDFLSQLRNVWGHETPALGY